MRSQALIAAACALVASAWASPLSVAHSIHEKRDTLPSGWTRKRPLHESYVLPMRIALTQSNLEKAHDWLMDVSHPNSDKYGDHWSAKDIAHAFAPSRETVEAVQDWLTSSGIDAARIKQSQSFGFFTFNASVGEAERLLKTQYHVYEHESTGQPHVACEQYSLPSHLAGKVDFVTPTVHFDAKVRRGGTGSTGKKKRNGGPPTALNPGLPSSGNGPKWNHQTFSKSSLITQLQNCYQQITPWCLRVLYRFPPGFSANPQNSYGIVEYTPQAYLGSDLDMFFTNFSTHQVGNRPRLDSIDGGFLQTSDTGFGYNGESDLDLEYAMTLVYPQNVTLYQVGDDVEGASFNNFLDGIDGSYCTFEGGNDPNYDGTYPDPDCSAGSYGCYEGPLNCGGYSATKVISTSYGYNEQDLTPAYEMRQCMEYMKLGLMGVSVLYSSGDNGVAGNGGFCLSNNAFNPSFPSTCPYVTSVGATQIKPNTNILNTSNPEQACETVIYSGGGFSNVFSLPSYQSKAVGTYFSQYAPAYGAGVYNNSGQTRGYPDVSANGANYVVAVNGAFSLVYGTSAASPTFGSILTLINEARYDLNKSSIGFINPLAYAHPEVFNDITSGNNPGCNTNGFTAVKGWDPVTGLGTPNFPKMLALWLRQK